MLSEIELLVAGLVASAITQVLKLVAARLGYAPSRVVVNIGLLVVSLVLAGVFRGLPQLPPLSDPLALAQALLGAAAAVVGVAALFYEFLGRSIVFPAIRLS